MVKTKGRSAETLEQAFCRTLVARRKKKGLSQMDLAVASGYSLRYIGDIERGAKSATMRTMHDLATLLDVRLGILVVEAENLLEIDSIPAMLRKAFQRWGLSLNSYASIARPLAITQSCEQADTSVRDQRKSIGRCEAPGLPADEGHQRRHDAAGGDGGHHECAGDLDLLAVPGKAIGEDHRIHDGHEEATANDRPDADPARPDERRH